MKEDSIDFPVTVPLNYQWEILWNINSLPDSNTMVNITVGQAVTNGYHSIVIEKNLLEIKKAAFRLAILDFKYIPDNLRSEIILLCRVPRKHLSKIPFEKNTDGYIFPRDQHIVLYHLSKEKIIQDAILYPNKQTVLDKLKTIFIKPQ